MSSQCKKIQKSITNQAPDIIISLKWTLPNVITLILHCLRHFSIGCKYSINFCNEIMGFSHSVGQAFFIAVYIIPKEEGINLELFCVTSLVSKNFQDTCRIKVSKVFAFSHIWNGQHNKYCFTGKVPWKPGSSSSV